MALHRTTVIPFDWRDSTLVGAAPTKKAAS